MNEYLNSQIKQDYLILKTFITDNFKLAQFLKIDFADASRITDSIHVCKDSAHIELKQIFLNQIFFILDDALYKMITPGKLNEALKIVDSLVFLTAVSFKVFSIKPPKKKPTPDVQFDVEDFDIKTIIKQLPLLPKEIPETAMYVRIMMNLLKKYKEITLEMDEKIILANEKNRESLTAGYKKELEAVILSIKKHYFNMIMAVPLLKSRFEKDRQKTIVEAKDTEDPFFTYDFTLLKHHILKQLSEYSKIRSSLLFIKKEGMDVLSIIKDLYTSRQNFTDITKTEEAAIFNVMSVNKIPVNEFNLFLFKIAEELSKYIHAKFIAPYSGYIQ